MAENSLANKINDLRKLAEDRKSNSLLLPTSSLISIPAIASETPDVNLHQQSGHDNHRILHSSSTPVVSNVNTDVTIAKERTIATNRSSGKQMPKSFSPSKTRTSNNAQERPASRMEIIALEQELEERVRLVLEMNDLNKGGRVNNNETDDEEFGSDFSFDPNRESMMTVKKRMLAEFGVEASSLHLEPWLDSFIKCECLKVMCDEVSSKFSDMLAINSIELGNVLRKLRLTYKQSFEQMHFSWKNLRQSYLEHEVDLHSCRNKINQLTKELENKEIEMNKYFDSETKRLNDEFNAEKARDQEKLAQTEFKMDQMSDTLKYLNGIFRTMQTDGGAIKAADLQSRCYTLENENAELLRQNATLDSLKASVSVTEQRFRDLAKENKQQKDEINNLNLQLQRRDEVIKGLMEREALRNAEIEKLQKISKMKDDELIAVDLKDTATSVLCIKCKKSLDDLTNIREAILGNIASGNASRLQCQSFRILLPNLKGRQPNRNMKWLRQCMRSILLSKLKEDVHLQFLKGSLSRFPAYVHAWFVRKSEGRGASHLSKQLAVADEDRWGLYYGIRALSKEDPEALVFWSLLDETYGEDGLQFIMYSLSVLLSLGGPALWKQFGSAMDRGATINDSWCKYSSYQSDGNRKVLDTIWIDIEVAKEAVKMILVRALAPHVSDALDAIDALKVAPSEIDLQILQSLMQEDLTKDPEALAEGEDADEVLLDTRVTVEDPAFMETKSNSVHMSDAQPTHINLFMWMRLMLQQVHADQLQRAAAVRLMFETASVGALTSSYDSNTNSTNNRSLSAPNKGSNDFGATGAHVEFPQFQSICQTLFPRIPSVEIASLYVSCFDVGQHRVHSETFVKLANERGLFAYALKLPTLPLLRSTRIAYTGVTSEVAESNSSELDNLNSTEQKDESNSKDQQGDIDLPAKKLTSLVEVTLFKMKTEEAVRSKLVTLVHRKLATITPVINHMLVTLPERWRTMLEDALETVKASLHESHQRLRENASAKASQNYEDIKEVKVNKTFIDGIQPYVHYRRLILMCSLIRSLCENPLLPTELFSAIELNTNNIDIAMFKAEKILTSLEHGFLLVPGISPHATSGNAFIGLQNKYHSFEQTRTILVARRLQLCFRKFLCKDIAIPRSVRLCMAPGYLGMGNATKKENNQASNTAASIAISFGQTFDASNVTFEHLPLKHRDVYHEPWWAQALVAEIYRFKLAYDAKAAALGLNPISLAQAVMSSQFCLWGTIDLAETMIHDLFICIRAYRLGVPRLRLFAAFLGDGKDMDENILVMLKTPNALAVYLSLLIEIHRELQTERETNLQHLSKVEGFYNKKSELNAAGIGEDDLKQPSILSSNSNSAHIINVLFPSTENSLRRQDKREVWNCNLELLIIIARRWSAQQIALGGSNVYIDAVEKLRVNALGQAEVDDFLWIMMIQWAKLSAWYVTRSNKLSSNIEKNHIDKKLKSSSNEKNSADQMAQAIKNGSSRKKQILERKSSTRTLPILPAANLRSIIESIYRPVEGISISDPNHFVSSYLHRIASQGRVNLKVFSHSRADNIESNFTGAGGQSNFSSEMEKVLQDCVLWDTISLGNCLRGRLDFLSIGSMIKSSAKNAAEDIADTSNSSSNPVGNNNVVVLLPFNPELSYAMVRSSFNALEKPIRSILNMVSCHPYYGVEEDMKSKIQAITYVLDKIFHELDKVDVAIYKSYKLYAHDADSSSLRLFSLEQRTAVLHLAQRLSHTEIDEITEIRLNTIISNRQIWNSYNSLMTAITELTIATAVEPPRDAWVGGTKVHVDKAYVYSIHTKNSLNNAQHE